MKNNCFSPVTQQVFLPIKTRSFYRVVLKWTFKESHYITKCKQAGENSSLFCVASILLTHICTQCLSFNPCSFYHIEMYMWDARHAKFPQEFNVHEYGDNLVRCSCGLLRKCTVTRRFNVNSSNTHRSSVFTIIWCSLLRKVFEWDMRHLRGLGNQRCICNRLPPKNRGWSRMSKALYVIKRGKVRCHCLQIERKWRRQGGNRPVSLQKKHINVFKKWWPTPPSPTNTTCTVTVPI